MIISCYLPTGKRRFEGRMGIFGILTISLIVTIKPLHKGNPIGSLRNKDYIKKGYHFANIQPVNTRDKR